ncbi:MAG: NADH-quinone oxidoreductase subunit J [bacterium]
MEVGFYVLGALAVFSAMLAISLKSLIRAVMALALFFICIGGLYINMSCEFLGFVQILIYVGGVIVLFLFVIMTSGNIEAGKSNWILRIFGLLSSLLLFLALVWGFKKKPFILTKQGFSGIREIGDLIMTQYLIQFEVVSLLLLVVLIGAIVLLKRE